MSEKVPTIANHQTFEAFNEYLLTHPNRQRVTEQDFIDIIGWLTDPNKQPKDQAEYSRRNYVRQTFKWVDVDNSKTLYNISLKNKELRPVVINNHIVECVESVHIDIGHLGWDATWKEVKKNYYGILKSDVIFFYLKDVSSVWNVQKTNQRAIKELLKGKNYKGLSK